MAQNYPAVQPRLVIISVLLGLLCGALWAMAQPRIYVAQVTLYFPAVQPQLFLNLTQALRSDPTEAITIPSDASGNPEVGQMAVILFRSQAAAEAALNKSGESTARAWWSADPVEAFQHRLSVDTTDPSTVVLRVESKSGNSARVQLQGLLDYYTSFVEKNPLTRVKKTRLLAEARLQKVVKDLAQLEDKMSRSSSKELRTLGDASIKANSKVMTQVWMRRLEEEGRGRELLDKLQRVRGKAKPGSRPEDAWMADWAAGQKARPRPSPGLMRVPVRRQDLLERAQLERAYYEALLKHRSLVLQHSFLLTWESLESSDFEVLDPLTVRSHRVSVLNSALLGAGLGLVAGLGWGLWRPQRRRNQSGPRDI